MGKLISKTQKFAEKFSNKLAQIPAAYFVACLTMKEDTEENRATVSTYLEPLRQIKLPIGEGFFGGKVDQSKMEYGFQIAFSSDKEGSMADGDYRNWESIRAWGQEIGQKLAG
jgi:menaquinone-dependent protoporphyrinogen IX oxidase